MIKPTGARANFAPQTNSNKEVFDFEVNMFGEARTTVKRNEKPVKIKIPNLTGCLACVLVAQKYNGEKQILATHHPPSPASMKEHTGILEQYINDLDFRQIKSVEFLIAQSECSGMPTDKIATYRKQYQELKQTVQSKLPKDTKIIEKTYSYNRKLSHSKAGRCTVDLEIGAKQAGLARIYLGQQHDKNSFSFG